jgi:CheY-like chemotaxis protein
MRSRELFGRDILVVEDEPLIALELRTALEAAGATVVLTTVRSAARAIEQQGFSVAILDLRPGASDHRPIARLLRRRGVPFMFYSTHPPEDVTTVRGAPVVLKPENPNGARIATRSRNVAGALDPDWVRGWGRPLIRQVTMLRARPARSRARVRPGLCP